MFNIHSSFPPQKTVRQSLARHSPSLPQTSTVRSHKRRWAKTTPDSRARSSASSKSFCIILMLNQTSSGIFKIKCARYLAWVEAATLLSSASSACARGMPFFSEQDECLKQRDEGRGEIGIDRNFHHHALACIANVDNFLREDVKWGVPGRASRHRRRQKERGFPPESRGCFRKPALPAFLRRALLRVPTNRESSCGLTVLMST